MSNLPNISELDGRYTITYQAQAPEIPNLLWVDHTFAEAEIKDGNLVGTDEGGCTWKAQLFFYSDNEVQFKAVVDTELATPNTWLMSKNGIPTRLPQDYQGSLKIARIFDKLAISGKVEHGVVTIFLNLNRI